MTNQPLVSVVTPVYNGEAHLRACIESVLAQTYTNWDYTVANNCSTDRTVAIVEEYAARDPRIRLWNAPSFVRVEQNYNNAVRQISATSNYCKVVAADDWIAPQCLEKMVALAEQNPTVAIVGAYGMQGTKVEWQGLPYSTSVVNGRELCRKRLLGMPYIFGTATSLLYRSDVIRAKHAFFNEANLHCDSEACLEVLANHDFGFIHEILTFQGVRPDSLTAMSLDVQTYIPQYLLELSKYGPIYLTPEELSGRINEQLRWYYIFLAKQVFERRDKEFWNYHRTEMEKIGFPLDSRRLAKAVGRELLEMVSLKNVVKGAAFPFRRFVATATR